MRRAQSNVAIFSGPRGECSDLIKKMLFNLTARKSLELTLSVYLIIHSVGGAFSSTEAPNYSTTTLSKQIIVSHETPRESHLPTVVGKQHERLIEPQEQQDELKHLQPDGGSSSMVGIEANKEPTLVMNKRETIYELSNEFWKLFDELWKLNNVSASFLTNWNVAGPDNTINQPQEQEIRVAWTDSLISETSTSDPRNTSTTETPEQVKEPEVEPTKPGGANETVNEGDDSKMDPVIPMQNNNSDSTNNQHKISIIKNSHSNGLVNIGFQLRIWFLRIRMKIRDFLSMLSRPFVGRYQPKQASYHHSTTIIVPGEDKQRKEEDPENREPSAKSLDQGLSDEQVRQMEKRHAREDEAPSSSSDGVSNNVATELIARPPDRSTTRSCPDADFSKRMNKCKSTEQIVSANLSTSFLYTLESIEETCRHITYLFNNCWPKQLQYLKYYVTSSWNETLLETTDFPLRWTNSSQSDDNSGMDPNCGTSPQETRPILDRINWMWLNLCMDKKFRLDYVEHLKCLGTWGDLKSHSTCQNEYKRLRNYINPYDGGSQAQVHAGHSKDSSAMPIAVGGKSLSTNETQTNTSRTSAYRSGNNTSMIERSQESSSERELEKKTHCCLFDVFLRCVHRQSIRDCGRAGSQFVVNFLARIGTDDMKYLCKKELSAMSKGKQSGNRKGSGETNDRYPFIESIYCADPRIHNALYGSRNDDKVRFPGANANVTPRPASGRNNNRGPAPSSYQGDSDGNGSSRQELTIFNIYISLVVVIVLHLKMLF